MQTNLAQEIRHYDAQRAKSHASQDGLDSPSYLISEPSARPYGKTGDPLEELTYKVEQAVAEEINPPFSDMAYGLATDLASSVYSSASQRSFPTRRESIDYFEKKFWSDALDRNRGILSEVARDTGRSREKLYGKLRKYGLMDLRDQKNPEWLARNYHSHNSGAETYLENIAERQDDHTPPWIEASSVESTLTNSLSRYRDKLHPTAYDNLKASIAESSETLANRISAYLPGPDQRLAQIMEQTQGVNNYRKAKAIFERQVVYDALAAAGFDREKAARYLGDSRSTIDRKIRDLSITEEDTVVRIDDFVKHKLGKEDDVREVKAPKEAVGEIERFHQLVREYNERRETERKRKEHIQIREHRDHITSRKTFK